jgi:hypothetical protein
MRLLDGKDQSRRTLEEFYGGLAREETYALREIGKAMLSLIRRLKALPDERVVYGLTSHEKLGLLAEDSYRSPCYVVVSALKHRSYVVVYLMPASSAPWPDGCVSGRAQSEDEAVRMIEIAMERSEGWSRETSVE